MIRWMELLIAERGAICYPLIDAWMSSANQFVGNGKISFWNHVNID